MLRKEVLEEVSKFEKSGWVVDSEFDSSCQLCATTCFLFTGRSKLVSSSITTFLTWSRFRALRRTRVGERFRPRCDADDAIDSRGPPLTCPLAPPTADLIHVGPAHVLACPWLEPCPHQRDGVQLRGSNPPHAIGERWKGVWCACGGSSSPALPLIRLPPTAPQLAVQHGLA